MNQILILKDVAYASGCADINALNSLATGSYAVFAEDSTMLTNPVANTELAGMKKVWFAVGDTVNTSKSKIGLQIDRATAVVTVENFIAPVGEVHLVGGDAVGNGVHNIPTPLVVGDELGIIVTSTLGKAEGMGSIYNDKVKRYDTVIKAGDTFVSALTRISNAINADTEAVVTSVVNGVLNDLDAGLTLTNVDVKDHVEVKSNGMLIDADIDVATSAIPVSIVYGNGTPEQVAALELEFSSLEGNTNQILQPALWFKYGFQTVPTTNYDLVTITWAGKANLGQSQGVKTFTEQKLIIAIPTAPAVLVPAEVVAHIALIIDLVNSPL
jgi:hypothetical protein